MKLELHATGLRCVSCANSYPLDEMLYACPSCSGLLEVEYSYDNIANTVTRNVVSSRSSRSMWRYSEFLPVEHYQDVTLGEGLTAITRSRRVEKEVGLGGIHFKQEFTCPTGSFKDRGSCVLLARAKELGFQGVVIDSSGNAAASLATYAARASLKCLVFVPSYVSISKLIQCTSAGAEVIKVLGTRQQTYDVANRAREKLQLFYCGFQTNCFSSEGVKTIAYEICEQFDWDPPDWVVFPVGTGSGLSGCFKGFWELEKLGWIDRMPSIACVQPEGCGPISRAFKLNQTHVRPVENPSSIAEGLLITNPLRGNRVLSILKETKGVAETVTDSEIEEAARVLISREGLFVEPSAAASYAGLVKLTQKGAIGVDETVVCVLTGSGLKTCDFYRAKMSEPRSIDPTSDIASFLGQNPS